MLSLRISVPKGFRVAVKTHKDGTIEVTLEPISGA
jgi:hypothetical protein